jgi:excinuclease ABC subunit C
MWENLLDIEKKDFTFLPRKTGIYKFYDESGKVLYVGKALNLKARITSYFKDSHYDRPHIIAMIPLIKKVGIIEVDNEIESLILESALVKKYQPKFNVELKDDKSFSWIYISMNEKFPSVKIVRSIKKGDYQEGRLFGPYPKGNSIKSIFNYVRKLYPFCTCKNPKTPCLYYHLNLCPAPYHGKISHVDYMENINSIIKFLEGRKKNIIRDLDKKMKSLAKGKEFEEAGVLRDKIKDLEYISQKIGFSPFVSEDEYMITRYEKIRNSLENLKNKLGSKKLRRIECYDISNIQGKFAYGAMSVAVDGQLKKDDYRVFKISQDKIDDPAMLRDVVKRRLEHLGNNLYDSSLFSKPDLILIDGGKGQLSVLHDLIPKDIKMLGISKGKHLKKKKKKAKEEFWILEEGKYRKINIEYPFLLAYLRDEAHRFGLKHYRKNIGKYSKTSALDRIEGIGSKRRKLLLREFKNIENIKTATIEDLNLVLKNKTVAKRVYDHFQN